MLSLLITHWSGIGDRVPRVGRNVICDLRSRILERICNTFLLATYAVAEVVFSF